MVCISIYGRRGSFFNISCTKTLFCPEISLVRLDTHSLTLPLSSDTSQVAFHSVQHSAFRSKVRTVLTLPLYFISHSKYGSKYPNFFYVQGDIPPVRIPMSSWEIQLSFDAHQKCFELEVTGAFWENACLPYLSTVFSQNIVRVGDITANYKQLSPIDFYKIRLKGIVSRYKRS